MRIRASGRGGPRRPTLRSVLLSVIGACLSNNCPPAAGGSFFDSTPGRLLAKMNLPAQSQGPHALLLFRTASHHGFLCAALGSLLLAASVNSADEPTKAKTAPALRQQLNEAASITWEERGLRSGLARVSQVHGIEIFLD